MTTGWERAWEERHPEKYKAYVEKEAPPKPPYRRGKREYEELYGGAPPLAAPPEEQYGAGFAYGTTPRTGKGEAWFRWYQSQFGVTPTPAQLYGYERQFLDIPPLIGSHAWRHGEPPSGVPYGKKVLEPGYYNLPTEYPSTLEGITPEQGLDLRRQYLIDIFNLADEPEYAGVLGFGKTIFNIKEALKAGVWGESLPLWDVVQRRSASRWQAEYPMATEAETTPEYPYLTEVLPTGVGERPGRTLEEYIKSVESDWAKQEAARRRTAQAEAATGYGAPYYEAPAYGAPTYQAPTYYPPTYPTQAQRPPSYRRYAPPTRHLLY